jgi:hypothetical protein
LLALPRFELKLWIASGAGRGGGGVEFTREKSRESVDTISGSRLTSQETGCLETEASPVSVTLPDTGSLLL